MKRHNDSIRALVSDTPGLLEQMKRHNDDSMRALVSDSVNIVDIMREFDRELDGVASSGAREDRLRSLAQKRLASATTDLERIFWESFLEKLGKNGKEPR